MALARRKFNFTAIPETAPTNQADVVTEWRVVFYLKEGDFGRVEAGTADDYSSIGTFHTSLYMYNLLLNGSSILSSSSKISENDKARLTFDDDYKGATIEILSSSLQLKSSSNLTLMIQRTKPWVFWIWYGFRPELGFDRNKGLIDESCTPTDMIALKYYINMPRSRMNYPEFMFFLPSAFLIGYVVPDVSINRGWASIEVINSGLTYSLLYDPDDPNMTYSIKEESKKPLPLYRLLFQGTWTTVNITGVLAGNAIAEWPLASATPLQAQRTVQYSQMIYKEVTIDEIQESMQYMFSEYVVPDDLTDEEKALIEINMKDYDNDGAVTLLDRLIFLGQNSFSVNSNFKITPSGNSDSAASEFKDLRNSSLLGRLIKMENALIGKMDDDQILTKGGKFYLGQTYDGTTKRLEEIDDEMSMYLYVEANSVIGAPYISTQGDPQTVLGKLIKPKWLRNLEYEGGEISDAVATQVLRIQQSTWEDIKNVTDDNEYWVLVRSNIEKGYAEQVNDNITPQIQFGVNQMSGSGFTNLGNITNTEGAYAGVADVEVGATVTFEPEGPMNLYTVSFSLASNELTTDTRAKLRIEFTNNEADIMHFAMYPGKNEYYFALNEEITRSCIAAPYKVGERTVYRGLYDIKYEQSFSNTHLNVRGFEVSLPDGIGDNFSQTYPKTGFLTEVLLEGVSISADSPDHQYVLDTVPGTINFDEELDQVVDTVTGETRDPIVEVRMTSLAGINRDRSEKLTKTIDKISLIIEGGVANGSGSVGINNFFINRNLYESTMERVAIASDKATGTPYYLQLVPGNGLSTLGGRGWSFVEEDTSSTGSTSNSRMIVGTLESPFVEVNPYGFEDVNGGSKFMNDGSEVNVVTANLFNMPNESASTQTGGADFYIETACREYIPLLPETRVSAYYDADCSEEQVVTYSSAGKILVKRSINDWNVFTIGSRQRYALDNNRYENEVYSGYPEEITGGVTSSSALTNSDYDVVGTYVLALSSEASNENIIGLSVRYRNSLDISQLEPHSTSNENVSPYGAEVPYGVIVVKVSVSTDGSNYTYVGYRLGNGEIDPKLFYLEDDRLHHATANFSDSNAYGPVIDGVASDGDKDDKNRLFFPTQTEVKYIRIEKVLPSGNEHHNLFFYDAGTDLSEFVVYRTQVTGTGVGPMTYRDDAGNSFIAYETSQSLDKQLALDEDVVSVNIDQFNSAIIFSSDAHEQWRRPKVDRGDLSGRFELALLLANRVGSPFVTFSPNNEMVYFFGFRTTDTKNLVVYPIEQNLFDGDWTIGSASSRSNESFPDSDSGVIGNNYIVDDAHVPQQIIASFVKSDQRIYCMYNVGDFGYISISDSSGTHWKRLSDASGNDILLLGSTSKVPGANRYFVLYDNSVDAVHLFYLKTFGNAHKLFCQTMTFDDMNSQGDIDSVKPVLVTGSSSSLASLPDPDSIIIGNADDANASEERDLELLHTISGFITNEGKIRVFYIGNNNRIQCKQSNDGERWYLDTNF